MNIRDIILPREKTKNLRWFDVIIITLILFGKFIVISTQMYLATLKPAVEAAATAVTEAATEVAETTTDVATEGAAYSSNLRYQATMLAIVFIYLFIRNFDFKQVKFKLNWKIIPQYLVLFIIMGLSADILYLIFDNGYNYFSAESLSHINLLSVFPKFAALSKVAIIYALLNAFYEEFYFLGLLGTPGGSHLGAGHLLVGPQHCLAQPRVRTDMTIHDRADPGSRGPAAGATASNRPRKLISANHPKI